MNYFPKLHKKIMSLCFLLKSKVHTDTARLPSLLLPFRVMMSIVSPRINCTMYLFDRFIIYKAYEKAMPLKLTFVIKKALDECRYRYTLHYEPPTTDKRKNRQRNNILWYNPPFSKNVSTNIGHSSLP